MAIFSVRGLSTAALLMAVATSPVAASDVIAADVEAEIDSTSVTDPSPDEIVISANDRIIGDWIVRLEDELATVNEQLALPRTTVSPGYTMRVGSTGPRVSELTTRLAELGFLGEGQVSAVFDATVHDAVEAFQAATGMHVDGIVGPQTLGELNRSLEDTRHALSWSIQQMRDLRIDAPDHMLVVNVPSARAQLISDGTVLMDMAAAVGRYTRQTPLLADQIVNVTVNPQWSVPSTIMREDVLPLLRSEGRTGVYESTVFLRGEQVDPAEIDWAEVQPWEIYIRQTPGTHSALGRYLFSLTNDQNIFVHHTNYAGVFGQANRWVSSGCIRVEDARALALYLIGRAGYTEADFDRRLASGRTQVMPLGEHALPVFITYFTATPEAERVVFHRDVYGVAALYRPVTPIAASQEALVESDS